MLRAKAFAGNLFGDNGSDVILPIVGVILGFHTPLYGVLVVKALSSSWTSDGGAFGAVSSLEASSSEAYLDFPDPLIHRQLRTELAFLPRGELNGCC